MLQNGQAQCEVEALVWKETPCTIRAVFGTTGGVVAAYQHGFMLASVPVSTVFGLGGSIDCQMLRPTAGREAVTDESRHFVQQVLLAIEVGLAEHIAAQLDFQHHRFCPKAWLNEISIAMKAKIFLLTPC